MKGPHLTRREILASACRGAALAPFLTLTACGTDGGRTGAPELRGHTMSTTYRIRFRPPVRGLDSHALHVEVARIFRSVNARLSTWQAGSEIRRLNAAVPGLWVAVSEATRHVVAAAQAMRHRSRGAFDPTVGALVDLWGFGPSRSRQAVPRAALLRTRTGQVGAGGLEVRTAPPAVRRTRPGMQLDLSAIAQGHAVDQVADALARRGVEHFLIDLGGELRACGTANPAQAWRVAIKRPQVSPRRPLCIVSLKDAAIATSGVYVHAFEEAGQRYSHVIDPRTGSPVAHGLLSVSVVSENAMTADATATALLVMGPTEGGRFARENGLAALFAVERGGEVHVFRTPSFDARVLDEEVRPC